ncbi:MAG: hypothetical protein ACE5F4_02275 [Candidatus Paceibacteria bacterium]
MDNQNMEPQEPQDPDMSRNEPPAPPEKEGGLGPVIGIIIIIALLVIGGVYYFTVGIDQIQNGQSAIENEMTAGEEANVLRQQSGSTELADIEADLNATDLSGLDEASAQFEEELQVQ